MISIYATMAISSIKRSKWRSAFTMLGVIIGVVSVVMIFALGEGVKRQVSSQLGDLGDDLIVVRPGKLVERDTAGRVESINWSALFGQSTLLEADTPAIKGATNIRAVAPVAQITGPVSSDTGNNLDQDGVVLATSPAIQEVLNQTVETGEFFTTPDSNKNLVVLGPLAAKKLFGDDAPVGHRIKIRGVDFVVRGVMASSKPTPLTISSADFNRALYIPLDAAKNANGGTLQIREINIRVNDGMQADQTVKDINDKLLVTHSGLQDFSVLTPDDFVTALDSVFGILTAFIGAVAGISLLVGGIGIMNIMLVSVSERTREIGIRKAVGATNQQILGQFLIEAMVLSFVGGLIGVGVSAAASVLLSVYTDLTPFMQPKVIGVALGVATVVGVVFGIAPAFKAASKDPIESLR